MQEDAKQAEALSPEVQDVMRNFVTAVRAVKLYPANNPVYSQSVRKAYEALAQILSQQYGYQVGIRKGFFTYGRIPIGKDTQINRAIALDLYAKGIREIEFRSGVTEKELLDLYQALALSTEEMAMKSGISSILWERGATHVKLTESGLDEVITTRNETEPDSDNVAEKTAEGEGTATPKRVSTDPVRTLVLSDLLTDPEGYGAAMVELARQTVGENETVEDRLFSLYKESGRQIAERPEEEQDALFDGLAQSLLSVNAPLRNAMVAGRLYTEMDGDALSGQGPVIPEELPGELHEIMTGRYARDWSVPQVSTLLKRSSQKRPVPLLPPSSPEDLPVVPLPPDAEDMAKEMAEYSPEDMEDLRIIGESGMESDIIEASLRTLIFLMTLVKDETLRKPIDQEVHLFSGIVHQIEEMFGYLIKQKDYDLAGLIIRALHMPVAAEFKPRLDEAVRKTRSPKVISGMINELRTAKKGSAEYQAAYSYLVMMERETTEVMLGLLAEETDRVLRLFLVELLKDVGRNQTDLIADQLNDERWYVVRNAIRILSENANEQVISYLLRAADNENLQVRQEVARGLIMIGGKKAAVVLARYLKDKSSDMQFMALRGLGEIIGAGVTEAQEVVNYLQNRRLSAKENELTIEGIKVLGRIGDRGSAEFLKRYARLRWWKPRRIQSGPRDAALVAIEEIRKRRGDDARTAG
jgi:hypothetical protein